MTDLTPVPEPDVPDVEVRRSGTTVHVVLNGELDIATGSRMRAEIDRVLSTDPGGFVIDLRGLEFMDSSGLSACYHAINRAEALGIRGEIVRGGPAVQRIFSLAGLEERLPFVDTPLAA